MASYRPKDIFLQLETVVSKIREHTKHLNISLEFNHSYNYDRCVLQYKEYVGEVRRNVHDTNDMPVVYLYKDLSVSLNLSFAEVTQRKKKKNVYEAEGDIETISMHFFKEYNLITRLEWVNGIRNKTASLHPQPHWHIPCVSKKEENDPEYELPDSNEPSYSDQTNPEDFPQEENYITELKVENLHLPMCRYDKKPTDIKDGQSLIEWIESSIQGFVNEYKYLVNKDSSNVI